VILVLYHPEQKQAYWQIVIEENVVSTGKGWKIYVPKDNNFSNAADCLKKFSSLFESHINKIVYKAIGRETNPEVIESLRKAITALVQGKTHATPSQIDAAFAALRKGDSSLALRYFEEEDARRDEEANDKLRAEIKRNIGALAFLDDTQKSLKAYRRATQLDPDNADGWTWLGHLLVRIGELDEAINAYQTVLRLGQEHKNQEEIAAAYGNLGNVYDTRGDLDKAVDYYNKALQIDENLGCKEGMANAYSNLGIVYATRGNLDKAAEYIKKSLKINEILGHKEGVVANYCNLGIVYRTRDDLDKAVEYYNKALQISENLGDKEKMAAIYCNLGNVFRASDDLDKAVEYYNKALQIDKSLGHNEGMAANYGNLGNMYRMRGDLDKATDYYHKSLKIEESLGHKEGMASDYANLGLLYATQKDYKKAREYWEKSLPLYQALGMPDANDVQSYLDRLAPIATLQFPFCKSGCL
jgi:tetratricopeptide (TPR) repeat protein